MTSLGFYKAVNTKAQDPGLRLAALPKDQYFLLGGVDPGLEGYAAT
jgi:hypothetical protein